MAASDLYKILAWLSSRGDAEKANPNHDEHGKFAASSREGRQEEKIINAADQLSGSKRGVRVRIADIHEKVPELLHHEVGDALKRLQQKDKVVIYPLDDPKEITAKDTHYAVKIAGIPHHIVYVR